MTTYWGRWVMLLAVSGLLGCSTLPGAGGDVLVVMDVSPPRTGSSGVSDPQEGAAVYASDLESPYGKPGHGTLRWLVMKIPENGDWPVSREDWRTLGFAVLAENSGTGTLAADWVAPNDLPRDDKSNYVDRFRDWVERLNAMRRHEALRESDGAIAHEHLPEPTGLHWQLAENSTNPEPDGGDLYTNWTKLKVLYPDLELPRPFGGRAETDRVRKSVSGGATPSVRLSLDYQCAGCGGVESRRGRKRVTPILRTQ